MTILKNHNSTYRSLWRCKCRWRWAQPKTFTSSPSWETLTRTNLSRRPNWWINWRHLRRISTKDRLGRRGSRVLMPAWWTQTSMTTSKFTKGPSLSLIKQLTKLRFQMHLEIQLLQEVKQVVVLQEANHHVQRLSKTSQRHSSRARPAITCHSSPTRTWCWLQRNHQLQRAARSLLINGSIRR